MIYGLLFLLLTALSYWHWRYKYIDQQVARNLAAFQANGSADDLQAGYHSRETWRRVWVGLACCVVPAVPLGLQSPWAAGLGFLSVAALLAGVFARDFTPKLNLARMAAGQTYLGSEWYASPASKSWPDAAAWKKVKLQATTNNQPAANDQLKTIVLRAWRLCLLVAGLLGVGAAWAGVK